MNIHSLLCCHHPTATPSSAVHSKQPATLSPALRNKQPPSTNLQKPLKISPTLLLFVMLLHSLLNRFKALTAKALQLTLELLNALPALRLLVQVLGQSPLAVLTEIGVSLRSLGVIAVGMLKRRMDTCKVHLKKEGEKCKSCTKKIVESFISFLR